MIRSLALASMILLLLTMLQPGAGAQPMEGEISGFTLDGEGEPLLGVNLTAENVTTGETFSTSTGENGSYRLSLPHGTYNMTASLANHTSNTTYGLEVPPSREGVNFTLSEVLRSVSGYVTNGTAPIPGAEIHLTSEERNYTAQSSSPLGAFQIEDVEPGTYLAHAEKQGYWAHYHDKPVVVERGEEVELNFTLQAQAATLLGKVKYGNDGLDGVRVSLSSEQFSTEVTTDSNGNYSISSAPAGNYTLTCTKEDFVEERMTVTLTPFDSKRVDVTLEKEADDEGGFIPGFDLPHSLMILGLIVSLITLTFALLVRFRAEKNPDLLEKEIIEEE
ncbi:MAG: carboxypeptidase-like regulatory domain-containing protein [Methanomassiliicoccales archaeon]